MLFPEDLSPELNCFFISANRHDRDRIELQFGFDGLVDQEKKVFEYTVEFLIFVPKSLGLLETDEYAMLRQEVQSYVRLHTHVTNPSSPTSLARVQERLDILKNHLALETLRSFAVDFEGFIKGQTRRFKKRIKEITADNFPSLEIKEIVYDSHKIEHLLDDFRSILHARGVDKVGVDRFNLTKTDHDLLILNEYLSHVYIQHLGEIQDLVAPLPGLSDLRDALIEMAKKEAGLREAQHFVLEERQGRDSSEAMEIYPRRSSVLKKYFQSPLFVQESGALLEKRLSIGIDMISGALAYAFFITIDRIFSLSVAFGTSTLNTARLLEVAGVIVVAYALREVIKGFSRKFFLATGGKFLSDNERKLFLENGSGKQTKIGKISEDFNSVNVKELPEKIQRIRYSVAGGDLERELGEDAVHFKKRVKLDLDKLDTDREFPWGLREIVRYRLDRLLPNMEDAFKKMFFVSKSGHVGSRQAHRIYNLHILAWIHAETPPKARPIKPEFRAFQITMDKSGILSCKNLKWDAQFGIPPTPKSEH